MWNTWANERDRLTFMMTIARNSRVWELLQNEPAEPSPGPVEPITPPPVEPTDPYPVVDPIPDPGPANPEPFPSPPEPIPQYPPDVTF